MTETRTKTARAMAMLMALAIALMGAFIIIDASVSDAAELTAGDLNTNYLDGATVEVTDESVTISASSWEQDQVEYTASAEPSSFTLATIGATQEVVLTVVWGVSDSAEKHLTFERVAEPEIYTHTIQYDANGGTGEMADTVVTDLVSGNSLVELAPNAFTKAGSHFTGWLVSGAVQQPGASVAVAGDATITATAQWALNDYTVTIVKNQDDWGTISATSVTVPYGTAISASSNVLTIGYDNVSATPASATAQYTYRFTEWGGMTETVTGNMTIMATFVKLNNYTVTFVQNQEDWGTISASSLVVPYGTVISANDNVLTIGNETVTATPASATAQYTYTLFEWSGLSAKVTGNMTIMATFAKINNHMATMDVQPGQIWSWVPEFNGTFEPTITVSASTESMPTLEDAFGTTSGYASVSNGTVTVQLPQDFAGDAYYLNVKAQTTQPSQLIFYEITFDVATYGFSYSADVLIADVGEEIASLVPAITGGPSAAGYAISGTLPAGLSMDVSTGIISGTPSAYKAQADYTITVTLDTNPVQTMSYVVSIGAFESIVASDYAVYAIEGETSVSVPGVSMPAGTVLDAMTLSAVKDGEAVQVEPGTAFNGMTVTASTGAIAGIPNEVGVYVFTETYTATAATGGSAATRTVTVVVEERVTLAGDSAVDSFYGHADSAVLLQTSGPNAVEWTIESVTKDSVAIASGADFESFSVAYGLLTSSEDTTAGTYVVTVKLASANQTVNTNGATGAEVSANSATAAVTFTVAEAIEFTNAGQITFYETPGQIYDSLILTTNIAGATFSVDSYGQGISGDNIAVSSDGIVTPGESALEEGAYTLTVSVQDPVNIDNKATATLTVQVVALQSFAVVPEISVAGI